MLMPLLGCDDSSIDELAQQLGVSAGDVVSPTDNTPATSATSELDNLVQEAEPDVVEPTSTLPEALINYWMVEGIYQSANVSDMSAEQAMEYEQNNAVSIGYDAFINHSGVYENPSYVVNAGASFADMTRYGIQTQSLADIYGADAKVTSISVSDENGLYITVLYWVADDVLIAFGKGMYVFSYRAVDAVG